jgi:acyl-coenzyme A thioesterase PaaI-like protein
VTGLEVLHAIAAGELPAAPFADLVGLEPVSAEEGRVVFAAVPEARHDNALGTAHGGLAATLLDSAMGCAVHSTLPAGVGSGGLRPPSSASRPTPRLRS